MNNEKHSVRYKPRRKRKFRATVLILLLVLVIIRLSMPYVILKMANKKLHSLDEYTGSIEDIDLRLIRGAYVAKDITLNKIKKEGETKNDTLPFIYARRTDVSVDWQALLKGKIKGRVIITGPVLNYVNKIKPEDIKEDTTDFIKLIKAMSPLTINRFEIRDGQIHYIDVTSKPTLDIYADQIHLIATNLTNVEKKGELLPAHVEMTANIYNGTFDLNIDLNPLKKAPTFEMQSELKNMELSSLNAFFRTYGNLEVKKGSFSMYMEFAGKNGSYGGYIKPFIQDFEIKKWKENDKLKQRIWEVIVGASMKVLENPKTDKVATKVPVEGEFSKTEIDIYHAIHYILRNAFVKALKPVFDNSINVNNLKDEKKETFLEKVFDGDKKDNIR